MDCHERRRLRVDARHWSWTLRRPIKFLPPNQCHAPAMIDESAMSETYSEILMEYARGYGHPPEYQRGHLPKSAFRAVFSPQSGRRAMSQRSERGRFLQIIIAYSGALWPDRVQWSDSRRKVRRAISDQGRTLWTPCKLGCRFAFSRCSGNSPPGHTQRQQAVAGPRTRNRNFHPGYTELASYWVFRTRRGRIRPTRMPLL